MVPVWAHQMMAAANTYDPAAQALFARMDVQPDGTRKGLYNTTILALIAAGLWPKIRALWTEAAHDAQAGRLNWKSANYTLLPMNSPVFTVDRGYMTDGASSYLNTQYNISTDGAALQDNLSMGCYLNAGDDTANQTAVLMGSITGAFASILIARSTTDTLRGRINGATTVNFVVASATRYGFNSISRTGSAVTKGYKNASVSAVETTVSSATLPSMPIYIGGASANTGILVSASNNRHVMDFIAEGLSDTEIEAVRSIILNNYLIPIGAN